MFRSTRWRNEKNRIKATFKLQFHAAEVSKANADSLVVSVVPGDVGKPTSRLEKGIVREGSCKWEHPVYETITFFQDVKTGKIYERLYHFIVSTGLPKSRLVGEVSIDFADYADLTKVSSVSLPLKNTKTDGILHVSIQRLQENGDQRGEDSEDTNIKSQNRTFNTQLSNGDTNESRKSNYTEDGSLPNATIRNTTPLYDNSGTSSGSDITISSPDSSSGLNTPPELELRSTLVNDSTTFLSSQNHISANATERTCEQQKQSQWQLAADSDHGRISNGSLNGSQTAFMTGRSRQASDIEIEKLTDELLALARKANVSDLELQALRKQIVKESKKGQELSREITYLKEERDTLKSECEKLKAFHKRAEETRSKSKLQFEGGDPWAILEEIRQELSYEKDLNSNLHVQLQKMQESNAELILAVKDLDEMLEQKAEEISDLSNRLKSCDNVKSRTEQDDDEEQKALEALVNKHRAGEDTCLMEQKIMNLSSEVEILRRERDELEMQMEQLALDYEILKQKNHDMSYKLQQSQLREQLKMQYECSLSVANTSELEAQIENLHNEVKKLSEEKSDSLATINELENHIKNLEEALQKQAQGFEADLEAISRARVEQEQRAIIAEEALRKTRWKNANTAERLQEEFRKLSMQMASTFDANEKVAMNALAEASELCMQKDQLEKMLQKAKEELQSVKNGYEEKLRELSDLLNLKMDQIEQMLGEIDDKSKQLEQQKQHEEELREDFSQELLKLKSELDRCRIDKTSLSEQAKQKENVRLQLEQMKASLEHTEVLMQKANIEKEELVSTISLASKEAEQSKEEFNRMKCLKDEKEATLSHFEFEVETLKSQCRDLKNSLLESELEQEKLRKQVIQFKSDLKKEGALVDAEKKLKERTKRGVVSDGAKNTLRNKSSAPVPLGSREVAGLKEKIKLLEGQIKLKETAVEASKNSFLEKEKDLRNIIEGLESRLEEVYQNSASLCEAPQQKFHLMLQMPKDDTSGITSNGVVHEKNIRSSTKDNLNADALSSELKLLKERNKQMENELREMQDRYSEISLKFAEVEGERQQLVMTVRNLKKTKKR